jgi:hypothetical protein
VNKGAGLIIPILFVIGLYFGLPAVMSAGWVRWAKSTVPRNLSGTLSLTSFIFSTSSGLLAASAALYARLIRSFPYYDPLLLKVFGWGGFLSLVALAFACSGAWRANPLRWYAPVCAVGMLLFWLMAATGE